ncbi:MAG: glycosylase [Alistipes sp.]|nr:glycosylase [Alistipes sp.]
MKRFIFIVAISSLIGSATALAQTTVFQEEMERVYNEVKTPYKYGLVVTAPTADKMTDSPSIFRKGDVWYMYYIIFDGRGYETWMATSRDLLHWKTEGKVMSFSDPTDWDSNQKAGYLALIDTKWGGSSKLKPYDGRYWMSYLGGNSTGYEEGVLLTGLAYSNNPTTATEWKRRKEPILSPKDKDAGSWESDKIYKSIIIEDTKKLTGSRFVMYYNAKGKAESIGMAVSDDMTNWKRLKNTPVLDHHRGITGDAYLQRMGKLWVMFYFGFSWNDQTANKAWDTFACSYDLVNWTDWQGEPLIEPSENFDTPYAHKPWVIKYKGVVYHFYCAVDNQGRRGIAVATSKDMGKSELEFPAR